MKKAMFFVTALILLSGAVFATGNLKVNVVSQSKELTVINIGDVVNRIYEIELKNDKGTIVYYKRTTTPSSSIRQHFDFSKVANGEYKLTVRVGEELVENSLSIRDGEVEMTKQRKETKPFFAVKDNRLELSWLNFEQEESRIQVYENSKMLFEQDIKPEFAINHALDLSKLNSGNYDIVLVTENNYYSYPVTRK